MTKTRSLRALLQSFTSQWRISSSGIALTGFCSKLRLQDEAKGAELFTVDDLARCVHVDSASQSDAGHHFLNVKTVHAWRSLNAAC